MTHRVPYLYFLEPKGPRELWLIEEHIQDNRGMIRMIGSQMSNSCIPKGGSPLNTCDNSVQLFLNVCKSTILIAPIKRITTETDIKIVNLVNENFNQKLVIPKTLRPLLFSS